MTTASDSTTENALIRLPAVNIDITALDAGENTQGETVIREERWAKQPHYAQGLLWDANDISGSDSFSDTVMSLV